MPEDNLVLQWTLAAGFDPLNIREIKRVEHLCGSRHPAPKRMLPNLLALLQCCHASKQKLCNWYFDLQDTIQNHYSTEGNCIFFGDAQEILSGEVDLLKEGMMNIEGCNLL
jgi:hypothetical protein